MDNIVKCVDTSSGKVVHTAEVKDCSPLTAVRLVKMRMQVKGTLPANVEWHVETQDQ
jgi:hypothetical protein